MKTLVRSGFSYQTTKLPNQAPPLSRISQCCSGKIQLSSAVLTPFLFSLFMLAILNLQLTANDNFQTNLFSSASHLQASGNGQCSLVYDMNGLRSDNSISKQ